MFPRAAHLCTVAPVGIELDSAAAVRLLVVLAPLERVARVRRADIKRHHERRVRDDRLERRGHSGMALNKLWYSTGPY